MAGFIAVIIVNVFLRYARHIRLSVHALQIEMSLTRALFRLVVTAVRRRLSTHSFFTTRRLLFLSLVFSSVLPAIAQRVPVTEKELPNGMRLLLVERHDDPTIAGGWVAHVGSANERPGITGIAHLFEHMMFKGTPTIGTKDFKQDQEIIAEQERVREQIRQEEAKMRLAYRRGEIADMLNPDNKTDRLKDLEKRFA